jgi:hypothetical protein
MKPMRCFCCDRDTPLVRKVDIRTFVELDPDNLPSPDSAAYHSYVEQVTYRWGFICLPCYRQLDNELGAAQIGANTFTIAGRSRGNKAPVFDQAKYEKFQRREAGDLGIDDS